MAFTEYDPATLLAKRLNDLVGNNGAWARMMALSMEKYIHDETGDPPGGRIRKGLVYENTGTPEKRVRTIVARVELQNHRRI